MRMDAARFHHRRSDELRRHAFADDAHVAGRTRSSTGSKAKMEPPSASTNLRGRLRALYADRARFTLEEIPPHGARATVEIPHAAE